MEIEISGISSCLTCRALIDFFPKTKITQQNKENIRRYYNIYNLWRKI